jgi:polyhydroxyalkanoate synthesis repressor PhaR
LHNGALQRKLSQRSINNRVSSARIYGSQWNFRTVREGDTMENNKNRVIKKYPNRRLYDTEESRYVTLTDIKKLVTERIHFSVTDKKTGEDITRSILLQIITEQEEAGEPLFTVEALEKIIGFYGKSVQTLAGDCLCQSLTIFQQQQEKIQSQMTEAMRTNPATAPLTDLAKQNFEMWNKFQADFFKKHFSSATDDSEK